MEERKGIVEAWAIAAANKPLYVVAHVSHQNLQEAKEMAVHAVSVGADGICYTPLGVNDFDTGVEMFRQVVSVIPKGFPIWFLIDSYCSPTFLNLPKLLDAVSPFANVTGAKYIEQGFQGFAEISYIQRNYPAFTLSSGGNPKLAFLPFGTSSFCACDEGMGFWLKCLYHFWESGDLSRAKEMQTRMDTFYANGAGGRELSEYYGISLGLPRLPSYVTPNLNATIRNLENLGFFDHSACLPE